MFNLNKKNYFRLIAFMLIVTTFLPIVYRNLPKGIGSFHFYALIWLASLVFYYHKIFLNKFFLVYGLIFLGVLSNTLWADMDEWNKKGIIQEFYYFSVAISVLLYFRMKQDYEGLARLTKWALIFVGITAVMTLYATSIDPMYARKIVGGDVQIIQRFDKIGGGEYGYFIALITLFPMMIYYYRNNNYSIFSKKLIIIFGILCFIAIVRAQFFSNVLLVTVAIIVSLLGRNRLQQSFVLLIISLIFFSLIPLSIYADLLVSIGSFFDSDSNIYYKLNDMASYLVFGDRYATGAEARADRYPLLIEAFIQNPIFGRFVGQQDFVKGVGAGGHLYWMNKLTIVGIFGFIPVLIIHTVYIKSAIKYFNKNFTFYFLVSVFSILVLGLLKNIGGREPWFTYFILLPGSYYLPLLKRKRE